jgi:hypothetical protein
MSPLLGYGMFVFGLLGYFGLTACCRTPTRRI